MRSVLLIVLVSCASNVVAAGSADVERCRQIGDPTARLACYDEALPPLPRRKEASRNVPPEPAVAGSVEKSRNKNADVSPTSGTATTAEFGLEERRQSRSAPESLESSIVGRFDGWVGNSRFRLANGQVWEIRDGSQAAYDLQDPKVRIVRGLSGTFFMEIAGVSQTPRVRRVE